MVDYAWKQYRDMRRYMTREEKLKMLLETGEFEFLKDIPSDTIWKLVFALGFIQNEEPCEEAISRKDAINALGYNIEITSDEGLDKYKSEIKEMLCKIYDVQKEQIEKLPSVNPTKTGHWIEKDGFDGDVYYDCSECGESWTTIDGTPWDNGMKFCPNCGAKMESEEV